MCFIMDKLFLKIYKTGVKIASFEGVKINPVFSADVERIINDLIDYNNTGEVMMSNDWAWNPKTNTLVVNTLLEPSDEDFMTLMENKPNKFFKPSKTYSNELKVEKSKPAIKYNNCNKSVGKKDRINIEELLNEHNNDFIEQGFYIENATYKMLLRNIVRGKNTMLVGPTGTGKTDIVARICAKLGIDLHIYDMGAMQDPMTDLLGTHRLENGSSIFDYSRFTEDIQKPGVILLDELSRAPLMTNNILFPCLDNRRTLYVDTADSKSSREIKVHPECVFIATANIGVEYAGTAEIDIALENRFMMLALDYIPADEEVTVLRKRTGIGKVDAVNIVTVANIFRTRYQDGELMKGISIRETLEAADMVADGFSVEEAIRYGFCEKFSQSSEQYDIAKKIVMGFAAKTL